MIDRPTVFDKGNNYFDLQIPYDVEFDFNGKHYAMRLINNFGVEESIIEKRDDLIQRGKLPRGKVFCLTINDEKAEVNVFSFSEKTFNYYGLFTSSLVKPHGEVENLQVKPVQALTQKFELDNIWEADGKWDQRPGDDPIWQKAREIYPDSIPLGVLKTEEVLSVVENLVGEADDKFRELGATEDQIAVAPDYTNALVEYVGTTGFRIGSANDWDSPVLFCEGNTEVGYNAVIDFASLDFHTANQFKEELCEALDFVGFDYILDAGVKDQIDPLRIGKRTLYIAPSESLSQAYKREYIDCNLRYTHNEWAKERTHQNQLKAFADKEVSKAKDEYAEVFDMISDVISDKELLAKSLDKLKEREETKPSVSKRNVKTNSR